MRGRRILFVAFLSVAFLSGSVAACSGGASHSPPVPVTHPLSGYTTPGAAVMGFFTFWQHGSNLACTFVEESDTLSCLEAMQNTKATFTGIGIGATSIHGNQALVTLVGRICVTSGGTTTCRSNSNTSVGQPKNGSQKAFDALYSTSAVGKPINSGALPCQKVSGKWYISLEASETE